MRDWSPLVLRVAVLIVIVSEAPALSGLGEYQKHHGAHYEQDQDSEHYSNCNETI